MLVTILSVLIGAVAAVLVYASLKPKSFALSRSAVIAASPERIFPLINDLRGFNRWNPFAKQDPDLAVHYNSVASGQGAAYTWTGRKAGAGRMEIAESAPPGRVTLKLDFTKPMEAHNTIHFTLEPQGDKTKVTWEMVGPMSYAQNVMTTFFNMDKMVGRQFEEGLASLRTLAEAPG